VNETMVRVANLKRKEELEIVRDALDAAGAAYEYVESDPEDYLPQTAYFQVHSDLAGDADHNLSLIAEEHDLEIEVL
jgi:hypothetical protein